LENAIAAHRVGDDGRLLAELKTELERKAGIARDLEERAVGAPPREAEALREEAASLWTAVGKPSVKVEGSPAEQETAVAAAAASADRDRLLAAQREAPEDPSVLLALLAHLGDGEPALRREVLERVASSGSGRAQAIALHELAVVARGAGK